MKAWRDGTLILEGNYKDYVKDGAFKSWHKNGILWEEEHYKNGEPVTVKEWDENGKLVREAEYKKNNMPLGYIGKERWRDEKGVIIRERLIREKTDKNGEEAKPTIKPAVKPVQAAKKGRGL